MESLGEKVNIDGSDVTALSDAFGYMGATIIGIVISIYCAIIIMAIWGIYGIILLVIIIINKMKEKKIK